jgi:hypothetical protein
MGHGGEVPKVIEQKCDDWLRKPAQREERALVALSKPRETEIELIGRVL